MKKCDFHGWATRNDIKCSDGRIIRRGAFKGNDGNIVPLVWNHQHDSPYNILGHAELENRDEGVYAYCTFNDTESGENAKKLVKNGDIVSLSIYANKLQQRGADVLHGAIREVSLVLAPANPGAYIESVLAHGEEFNDGEATIYFGEPIHLSHSEESDEDMKRLAAQQLKKDTKEEKTMADENQKEKSESEETIADVFNTLSEKQKTVVYALIGQALEEKGAGGKKDKDEGGNEDMKHNVFDENEEYMAGDTLSHSEQAAIFADAKRYGSLRDSFLAHGIDNIDYLFPDNKNITNAPILVQRDMGWVRKVMNAVHHTPFSRIKSLYADITEDDARAKGYIKGKLKKEEVFSLLKRTTDPTTVYKKQRLDRDDVIDIVDLDVVGFLKSEMRTMLDEEIARAALISDGRLASSDDKINETHIRPIAYDDDFYTIKSVLSMDIDANEDDIYRAFIVAAIKSRKNYKGSGEPTLYTTEDVLTGCLLLTDATGRDLYEDESKLAKKLRVKEIVTVPVMEGVQGKSGGALLGIIVNLNDYNIGADKGGAVNLFDDFDIDYNAMKYLIETRCSGALIKPYSAIAIETKPKATA